MKNQQGYATTSTHRYSPKIDIIEESCVGLIVDARGGEKPREADGPTIARCPKTIGVHVRPSISWNIVLLYYT